MVMRTSSFVGMMLISITASREGGTIAGKGGRSAANRLSPRSSGPPSVPASASSTARAGAAAAASSSSSSSGMRAEGRSRGVNSESDWFATGKKEKEGMTTPCSLASLTGSTPEDVLLTCIPPDGRVKPGWAGFPRSPGIPADEPSSGGVAIKSVRKSIPESSPGVVLCLPGEHVWLRLPSLGIVLLPRPPVLAGTMVADTLVRGLRGGARAASKGLTGVRGGLGMGVWMSGRRRGVSFWAPRPGSRPMPVYMISSVRMRSRWATACVRRRERMVSLFRLSLFFKQSRAQLRRAKVFRRAWLGASIASAATFSSLPFLPFRSPVAFANPEIRLLAPASDLKLASFRDLKLAFFRDLKLESGLGSSSGSSGSSASFASFVSWTTGSTLIPSIVLLNFLNDLARFAITAESTALLRNSSEERMASAVRDAAGRVHMVRISSFHVSRSLSDCDMPEKPVMASFSRFSACFF
mmetsp:Transcript_27796/g.60793  ORF Transcript_27796/g.60793 Transcript_27796/m.60793 type:complete len:468 (-) Transcript_27796:517-1920(-)